MSENIKVLVTGGAGFIGANLVRTLLRHGYQVVVLDNLITGRRMYLNEMDVEFIRGDILDRELVIQMVSLSHAVIHLAAQTGVPGSIESPIFDCKVNVMGTLNLLEAVRLHGNCRFVFASSNAPLGRQSPPATEEKAPLPISPYGASKLAGEGYCLGYHGCWGIGTVVLRFGNVYGPFSVHKESVIARFFKDIITKGELVVDGDGSQTRDFIYVEDLCRAILLALQSNLSGEVFQVATGVETSIQDLVGVVQAIAGGSVGVRSQRLRQGDIQRNYSTIDKVREQLLWEPKITLKEGLEDTWKWFRDFVT